MKQKNEPRVDQEKAERQQLVSLIGDRVMHALGQPGDLHRVQVRHLWESHYRVNVLVGGDATTVKIAHSFFLVADDAGNIIASTPNITKRY